MGQGGSFQAASGTVDKALFSITCTTCRARLTVRSAAVIGSIQECPKCGSMVQIVPPLGWKPPQPEGRPEPGRAKPAGQPEQPRQKTPGQPEGAGTKAGAGQPALTAGSDSNIGRRLAAAVPAKPAPPPPLPSKAVSSPAAGPFSAKGDPALLSGSSTVLAAAFCPPPGAAGPSAPPPASAATVVAIAAPMEVGATLEAAPTAPALGWLGMANFAWARWLVLGSAPLVGLGLIVAVWSIVASHRHRKAAVEPPAKAVAVQSPQGVPKPPPSLPNPRLDRRWLPDRTALVFSVHAKQLASQPQAEKSIRQLELLGHVPIDALLRSLGLTLDGVQRLTWAASDLAIWPERSVVVLELAPDHNTDALAHSGEAADVGIAGLACRRLPAATWPNPLLVVDRQTIVTGDESLLRGLGRRADAKLESRPLGRLLGAVALDADAMLLVDLAAAREARWKLPTALLDVWPPRKPLWHELCESPVGLGCTLYWSDPSRSELALVCESETAAEKVRSDAEELRRSVKRLLPKQAERAAGRPRSGQTGPGRRPLSDGAGRRRDRPGWRPISGRRRDCLDAMELAAAPVDAGRGGHRRLSRHARRLAGGGAPGR